MAFGWRPLLCQVFISFCSGSHVAARDPVLRREFIASGATSWSNVIAEAVDQDGDHMVVSECHSSDRPPDFASCREAAQDLQLPFHFGDLSSGCRINASPAMVTFNGSSDMSAGSLCVSHSLRMNLRMDPQRVSQGLKVFCFAWTTWKPEDLALLPEVRHAFRQCDGYRIFSDRQSFNGQEAPDVVLVNVSEQRRSRQDGQWLYHRNMAGLWPSWNYLLQDGLASQYDWLVNVEFDHFLSPSKLRRSVQIYLSLLQQGRPEQQVAASGPLMLMFGNAFLFNRMMVNEMRRQWTSLSRTAPAGHEASGCPLFMEGRFEWPAACSQDIAYPNLVTLMDPQIPAYGSPGCGQTPEDFPLACFELQRQPVQDLGLDQLMLVQKLANSFHSNDPAVLAVAKDVPIFHHLSNPAARQMARELLK